MEADVLEVVSQSGKIDIILFARAWALEIAQPFKAG
jgi:hypothetical protein